MSKYPHSYMNILFINNELSYGGAEKLLNDLLPRLQNDGISCRLLILTRKGEKYIDSLSNNGIVVDVVPETKNHIKRILFIKHYIENNSFDIIHANLFPTTYYISILKRIYGSRFPVVVMTEHSTDNKRRHIKFFRPVERLIYEEYERVISISPQTESKLLEWLKKEKTDQFVVIHNGIPLEQFIHARSYNKNELFEGIENNDVLLCMVGSFKLLKNHALMLDIIENLPEKYKLILAGEGPLLLDIKNLVKERRLHNKVRFLGFRNDIPCIMKSSDMIIIPSKWEGFGLVAAEAMACGKPVVASNVPGLAEVIGEGGLLAESNNKDDFIQKILSLEDKKKLIKVSETAQIKADEYDIEFMKTRYESVYQELVKREK